MKWWICGVLILFSATYGLCGDNCCVEGGPYGEWNCYEPGSVNPLISSAVTICLGSSVDDPTITVHNGQKYIPVATFDCEDSHPVYASVSYSSQVSWFPNAPSDEGAFTTAGTYKYDAYVTAVSSDPACSDSVEEYVGTFTVTAVGVGVVNGAGGQIIASSGDQVTFTAVSDPGNEELQCLGWEYCYRAPGQSGWTGWGSLGSSDPTVSVDQSWGMGEYALRVRNGRDTWHSPSGTAEVVPFVNYLDIVDSHAPVLCHSSDNSLNLTAYPYPSNGTLEHLHWQMRYYDPWANSWGQWTDLSWMGASDVTITVDGYWTQGKYEFRCQNTEIDFPNWCAYSADVYVVDIEITGVLSDQFSGADVNRLPPIGTYREKNKPMLMGCSVGTTAQIKIEATVVPSSGADYVLLGVRKKGTTEIINSHFFDSNDPTSLAWDSLQPAIYEIVAGVDDAGNGLLTSNEAHIIYPDGVLVFNQSDYNTSVDGLALTAVGGAFLNMPTASDLLLNFLGNTGNDTTVSVTDPYLYHPVGVAWTGNTGPCSKYNFDNLDRVVSATAFHTNLLSQAGLDHSAEINAYFAANPGSTHKFGPWSCAWPTFIFTDPGTISGIDADMYYAFAQVNGFTVTSYYVTLHDSENQFDMMTITATGYFYDLYDFDLTAGGFSILGAIAQAGYPTLGTSGRVFKEDQVNFNGTWSSP